MEISQEEYEKVKEFGVTVYDIHDGKHLLINGFDLIVSGSEEYYDKLDGQTIDST